MKRLNKNFIYVNSYLRAGVVELASLSDRQPTRPQDEHFFGGGFAVFFRRDEVPVNGFRDGLGGTLREPAVPDEDKEGVEETLEVLWRVFNDPIRVFVF